MAGATQECREPKLEAQLVTSERARAHRRNWGFAHPTLRSRFYWVPLMPLNELGGGMGMLVLTYKCDDQKETYFCETIGDCVRRRCCEEELQLRLGF